MDTVKKALFTHLKNTKEAMDMYKNSYDEAQLAHALAMKGYSDYVDDE